MKTSENAHSADNQQERLMKIGWIVGCVDGEGCFSIGFVKQPNRKEKFRERKGYKTGYQISHEFAVTQGESSLIALKKLKNFFGVGKIYINKRYDNHNEHLYRFVVRNRHELMDVIIPFFRKYKLRTAKYKDFKKFAQCVKLVINNKHLRRVGLIQIAKITEQMNHKKSRSELIRILTDHTPNSD